MDDIIQTLSQVEIFQDLDSEGLAKVAARCRRDDYVKGQQIIAFLDSSSDVYFIKAGRVGITIYSQAGKEIAFRQLGRFDMFGDIAAIDGNSRSASAITQSDVQLIRMSETNFRDLLSEMPLVNFRQLNRFARLIRALTERVYEFTTLGVRNRIHAELLRLVKAHMSGGTVANIYPAPTHADIASQISTHREAVSREFSRLSSEGLIERRGRNLIVHDVPRLEEMVSETEA